MQNVSNEFFFMIQYLVYLIFAMIILALIGKGYEALGMKRSEISTIFFLSLILSFIYIPIVTLNGGIILAISIGGALIPLYISWRFLRRGVVSSSHLLPIFIIATILSYMVTQVTKYGIVSIFPLYLIPPFITGLLSYFSAVASDKRIAPLAYASQTFGAILGADILHLPEILSMKFEPNTVLVIGGAGVFDMIYLSGLFAALFSVGIARAMRKREIELEGFSIKVKDIRRTEDTFIEYERTLEERILGRRR
ncbi:MAG: hypothetical protein DRN26_05055 [Thermoplasmata archaeon]|nr:MAG: hypothetical protein DRN26_05055 [Thermoplasmata archaeon]